ncbi:unnamed protein product [marine sediment metagenome]|uniref:Uncharacterized protein n=1 Tax=marine sediment metagenome TaxID=412755 RepID=X1SAN8_9ZZZZ
MSQVRDLYGLPNIKHFVAKLNLAKTTQKLGGFSFWGKKRHPDSSENPPSEYRFDTGLLD